MRAGEYCPNCGQPLLHYENPPRFQCSACGKVISGEDVLRPDPSGEEPRDRQARAQQRRRRREGQHRKKGKHE